MQAMLFAILTLLAGTADGEVSPGQFKRLMDGLHSEIRDVTLVYEGEQGLEQSDPEQKVGGKYQGLYSFRSDGATLMDVFLRAHQDDQPVQRTVQVILDGTMEGVSQFPDLGSLIPETSKAVPGALNKSASIERILYFWFFRTMDDPEDMGYEFQGWEDVDSHRCMRVQLYTVPAANLERIAKKPIIRLWIDIERGGHPLKVEFWAGSELLMRSEKIRLSQVPMPNGKKIWLPQLGELSSFGYLGPSGSPTYRETYRVVDGSVQLNRGLGDDYFCLKTNRELPAVGRLREYQRRLNDRTPIRTDPPGVKERLDRRLEEADRQGAELKASSAAREVWGWTPVLQFAFGALGVSLLGAVAYWKWRGR